MKSASDHLKSKFEGYADHDEQVIEETEALEEEELEQTPPTQDIKD